MDISSSAIMVLLACNPRQASVCHRIETPSQIYSSLADCQDALADRLARSPNGEILGRCRDIDENVTASLPDRYASVTVTRGTQPTNYLVPRKR